MSNKIEVHKNKLPTIQELYDDESLELTVKIDNFNVILNQPPPESWVKVHPYVSGHKYLPIEKVEWILRRIFKRYKIEITGQGVAFNGIWVTVRVHYFHPILEEWMYHDGIGSMALQVKKGSSPADLANINNGALSMAFPIAKSLAVKDATDHFGSAFGANLNRKDIMPTNPDEKLQDIKREKEITRLTQLIKFAKNIDEMKSHADYLGDYPECQEVFDEKMKEFK